MMRSCLTAHCRMLLSLVIIVMMLIFRVNSIKYRKFVQHDGWTLKYETRQVGVRNKVDCMKHCLTTDCDYLYYNGARMMCNILDFYFARLTKSETDDVTAIPTTGRLKCLFVRGHATEYVYTYSQAVSVCQSLNSRLMTLAELNDLDDGAKGTCSCGWLEDGTQKHPIHENCLFNQTEGMRQCNLPLSHAWCIIPE